MLADVKGNDTLKVGVRSRRGRSREEERQYVEREDIYNSQTLKNFTNSIKYDWTRLS